jgi:HK97 gp10 family phage protein
MTRTVFKIEGGKELDEALLGLANEFSVRNARNVMRGALDDGGKMIAEAASSMAPDAPGTGGESDLKSNIKVSGVLTKTQRGGEKGSAIERYVGPTAKAFHGLFQEFGTANHAAHPFLRPALDGLAQAVIDLIIRRTKERLEATRKRLARKAEREAARLRS